MIWLFEYLGDRDRHQLIAEELRKRGEQVVPIYDRAYLFGDQNWRCPEEIKSLPDDARVLTMGSVNICKLVKQLRPNWRPGVWDNWELITPLALKDGPLTPYVLSPSYEIMSWATLKEQAASILSQGSPLFIKPAADIKLFSGRVVSHQGWDDFKQYVTTNGRMLRDEALVMVAYATTQPPDREWRFYVHQPSGDVIAGSRYKAHGKSDIIPGFEYGAADLARDVVRHNKLRFVNPIIVIDVCRIGQTYKIIEVGTFSPAGVYQPNIQALVDRLIDVCDELYGK